MTTHADLIRSFAAGLSTGTPPAGMSAPDPAETAARFAVYRNNVAHGLSRALAARFPVVERLVGPAFFAAMAGVFIAEHPPRTARLFLWGAEFPAFLQGFAPAAALPYLPDVARLEWLRGEAYHAADAPPAGSLALARAASAPDTAMLALHPSVRVLHSRFAVRTIWQANQPGAAPAEIEASQPEATLILRDTACQVQVLPLAKGDAAFAGAFLDGAPLLLAARAAQRADPGHQPASLLLTLARHGALVAPDAGESA